MPVTQTGADPFLAGGRLTVDLDALVANWRDLAERSKPARCAAVVKADAYGLELDHVVPALARAGCEMFFVALPEEGVTVRRLAREAEVFVLNGIHPQSVATTAEAGLIPVLGSLDQIELWRSHCSERGIRKPCAIGVDTGMNRLGLTPDEAVAFGKSNAAEHLVPVLMVMSHLACADDPAHPLNAAQLESFQRVAAAFEGIDSSLCNSAGIFRGGDFLCDVTRPGISIYGGGAVTGTPNPMRPVVRLEGRIVQVRQVAEGDTVSYGATHRLSRASKIATVSVGYGDGYPRSGSGSGVPLRKAVPQGLDGFIDGTRVPLIGRVTMDLSMFDVTDVAEDALDNGWIELIGENIPLDEAAIAAGTIPYELLTSLGGRYQRRYLNRDEETSTAT